MLGNSMLDFRLTTGRFSEAFEKRFGELVGARHVITVNSGFNADLIMTNTFWTGVCSGLRQPQLDYALDLVRGFCKGRMQGYVRGR
jgi:hypothetical protein